MTGGYRDWLCCLPAGKNNAEAKHRVNLPWVKLVCSRVSTQNLKLLLDLQNRAYLLVHMCAE